MSAQKIVDFPAAEKVTSKHAFVKRWKHADLFKKGYIPLPVLFLHHYADLKPFPLTSGEALFVLHLMEFKWGEENPFPGYKTLATRMGISPKMARRHAQSLEQKHYLNREIRIAQTNRFDLAPLFDALLKASAQDGSAPKTKSGG